MGEVLKIIHIIFFPKKVFRARNFSDTWTIPFSIIFFTTVILAFFVVPQERLWLSQELAGNYPRSYERLQGDLAKPQVSDLINSGIGVSISLLVFSIVLFGISRFFRGKNKMKEYLAISMYGGYINLFWGRIFNTLWILIKGTHKNVGTSLAVFFDAAKTPSASIMVLANIDIFTIWSYILVAYGFSQVEEKPIKTGLFLVGIILVMKILFYLLFSVLKQG